jgi:TatD DNase family protein
MQLIDSHCHLDRLDLTPYQGDLALALRNAQIHGVSHFLCVAIDMPNFTKVHDIALKFANVYASVGLHPTEQDTPEPSVDELIEKGQWSKIVAIGETGLDYYRCETAPLWQQDRFRRHIQAAIAVRKPLIVHTRLAKEDTLRILKEENAQKVGGVLHCFTEDYDMAERAMAMGFYISISGIVSFKNAVDIQATAAKLPLERLLIETDAPYLAPVPHRGKSNEPAYVRYVAEAVAKLRHCELSEVAKATSENFARLFGVGI